MTMGGASGRRRATGETFAEAAGREFKEETGLSVEALSSQPAIHPPDDNATPEPVPFYVELEREGFAIRWSCSSTMSAAWRAASARNSKRSWKRSRKRVGSPWPRSTPCRPSSRAGPWPGSRSPTIRSKPNAVRESRRGGAALGDPAVDRDRQGVAAALPGLGGGDQFDGGPAESSLIASSIPATSGQPCPTWWRSSQSTDHAAVSAPPGWVKNSG